MDQLVAQVGLFDDAEPSINNSHTQHNSGLKKKAQKPSKPYPKQHLNYAIKQWNAVREDLKGTHEGIDDASLTALVTPEARHAYELRQLQLKHPNVPDKPFVDTLRTKWTKVSSDASSHISTL